MIDDSLSSILGLDHHATTKSRRFKLSAMSTSNPTNPKNLTNPSSDYFTHLSLDPKLKPILQSHGPFKLKKRKNPSLHLCSSIMSQQLSTKVADVIFGRFLDLFEDNNPSPEQILAIPAPKLRSIGLSNAKVSYVHNVARFSLEHGLEVKQIQKMDNEEAIAYLTQIKGVGRWTAEILLMFTLGREDLFTADDLGIQLAMKKLYRINTDDKKILRAKIIRKAESWSPFRTYACMHLWRWKDGG